MRQSYKGNGLLREASEARWNRSANDNVFLKIISTSENDIYSIESDFSI